MKHSKSVSLAAGLLACALALTGCSLPAPKPAADPAPRITAQTDSAQETAVPPETQAEEMPLRIGDKTLNAKALYEEGMLLLPLEETAAALGWDAEREEKEEETRVKKSVSLSKGESRITVSWVVSDNTAKQITWQKDGLLIPVDTELTSVQGVVYVPAAFFETAMDVSVEALHQEAAIHTPKPDQTPENDADRAQESGE